MEGWVGEEIYQAHRVCKWKKKRLRSQLSDITHLPDNGCITPHLPIYCNVLNDQILLHHICKVRIVCDSYRTLK